MSRPSPITAVREILVATDFSDQAEAAVDLAAAYARRFGARLHVLHVLSQADVDVTRMLADAVARASPDVPVVVATEAGDAADVIVRHARRHGIDLIVVGTHGRRGMSRALLGSVAERVVRGAPCPVLAVPPQALVGAGEGVGPDEAATVAPRHCIVCAASSRDLVCEPCRARIRGEALDRKWKDEHPARP